MKVLRLSLLLAAAPLLPACSFFSGGDDEPVAANEKKDAKADAKKTDDKKDEPAEEESGGMFASLFGGDAKEAPAKAKKAAVEDEKELKLAKLWARVDELEEEQYRQKERIRVLEKGLTLGLVPEELKQPQAAPPPPPAPKEEPKAAPPPVAKEEPKANGLSKDESAKYQTMLANAHDHYRAGRYGRAIVEFSEIGKQFGDKVEDGVYKYWIARSWINLKEYNTARQELVEFLKEHPGSPWVPRAKLELARVELQQGFTESALSKLKDIVTDYPNSDASEMAQMELQHLDKKL